MNYSTLPSALIIANIVALSFVVGCLVEALQLSRRRYGAIKLDRQDITKAEWQFTNAEYAKVLQDVQVATRRHLLESEKLYVRRGSRFARWNP